MILIYGDLTFTCTLTGSAGGSAFLTDQAALNDTHSGLIASMQWINGAQTTASYVDIALNLTGAPDGDSHGGPALGGVGVANVQGLPEGTKVELRNGGAAVATQRLRHGPNGELGAWFLPQTIWDSPSLRFYNDVNGVASIPVNHVWGAGEIIPGRVLYLPTMLMRQPSASLVDPTAYQTMDTGSVFNTFRKPARTFPAVLGPFSTADVNSSLYSSINDGGNPGANISLRRLQEIFSQALVMAVCDIPSAGKGAGVQHGKLRYDQEFMQSNFMLAHIINDAGTIQMDQPPKWSWSTAWRQAI